MSLKPELTEIVMSHLRVPLLIVLRIHIFVFTLLAVLICLTWPSAFMIGSFLSLPCLWTCWTYRLPVKKSLRKRDLYTTVIGIYSLIITVWSVVYWEVF